MKPPTVTFGMSGSSGGDGGHTAAWVTLAAEMLIASGKRGSPPPGPARALHAGSRTGRPRRPGATGDRLRGPRARRSDSPEVNGAGRLHRVDVDRDEADGRLVPTGPEPTGRVLAGRAPAASGRLTFVLLIRSCWRCGRRCRTWYRQSGAPARGTSTATTSLPPISRPGACPGDRCTLVSRFRTSVRLTRGGQRRLMSQMRVFSTVGLPAACRIEVFTSATYFSHTFRALRPTGPLTSGAALMRRS